MRDLVVAGVVFGAVAGGALAGCIDEGPDGTTGAKGKVVFQTELEAIFSNPVAVGSRFHVDFVAKDDDEVDLDGATLVVDVDGDGNEGNADIEANDDGFDVTLTKPGSVHLAVRTDAVVDFINVEARDVDDTSLVDGAVLVASDVVDARVPGRFAVLADQGTTLLVSAVDACSAGVIDLGASTVRVVVDEGVDPITVATVSGDGANGFVIVPAEDVSGFVLELDSPGLAPLQYEIDVVGRNDVDEVHAEVASVDSNANTARLWGRAFANDIDVVGLDFDWSADPRVALDAIAGAAVTATISFPTDGTVDDRPATVTAEALGERGTVDLLALQSGALVAARDAPPARADDGADDDDDADSSGDGCTGSGTGTCAGLVAVLALRRRRP